MTKKVGLWIDHKKAIIVTILEEGEEIKEIKSEVEKELRRDGDSPLKGSYEPVQVPADDRRQSSFTEHLNIYYDAVIDCMGDVDSILIFGAGEAKHELRKRLERDKQSSRIVDVLTVDKMSDRQIAAKAREYFRANHI